MSFLLPSHDTKNTQSNVRKEETLEDVQIDEQETDETEMNTYEIRKARATLHVKKLNLHLVLIHMHKANG